MKRVLPFQVNKDRNRKNGRDHEPEYLIYLKEVKKVYQTGGISFTALKGIDLSIGNGEFVSVVGKSGSGKSTLLNMITGIDRPTEGEVIIAGTPIYQLNEGKMAVWRGKNLGIVFQFFQLLPTLTVLENILLPMDFCRKYSLKGRRERAFSLLEEVDLTDQAHKLPANLSGGQQQRVAIVRALANDPPILVADEPTGNLDTNTAESIFQLFLRLVGQGKTVLTVTHDQDLAEKASRTIHISDGLIVSDSQKASFNLSPQLSLDYPEPIQVDLVKSGYDQSLQKSFSDQISHPSEKELDEKVSLIFKDDENAIQLLREEFFKVSQNEKQMERLYSAVLRQVQLLSEQAENENNPDESRRLWKIVMEATEPWAKKVG